MDYITILVDAYRPAMNDADKFSLPQTVFYHPDYGYAHSNAFAKILKDRQTTMHVTWLPNNYSQPTP